MYKYIILLILLVLITSCSSNEKMRKDFGTFGSKTRLLIDQTTQEQYLIKHYIGDIYILTPLYPSNLQNKIINPSNSGN